MHLIYFDVIKECKDGFSGPNCKKMCNETCKGCNKTTGVCDNGCVPGWKGQLCHEGKVSFHNSLRNIIGNKIKVSCQILYSISVFAIVDYFVWIFKKKKNTLNFKEKIYDSE